MTSWAPARDRERMPMQANLMLVRSVWRADVRILAREPEHEIEHGLARRAWSP